jgi:hypothetical protein
VTREDLLRVVAQQVVANAARAIDWQDYPDIGEYDWYAIQDMARELAPEPTGLFVDAYNQLAGFAAEVEA